LKVRAQVANPCEKKGDSLRGLPHCECLAPCKKQNGYLKPTSPGTIQYLRSQTSAFQGCLPLEESLIEENLIRYETREDGGFEVLFEGVESTQNLNSEIFEDDGTPTNLESFFNFIPDLLTDKRDNDRKLKKASHSDKNLRDLYPEALGIAYSSMAALWAPAPQNLQDSFFQSMYVRGDFERQSDDIQQVATCLYHGIDLPLAIKKIWPRYTEKRLRDITAKIWGLVQKRMPSWAKKFDGIWQRLTSEQAEALSLEWFYEAEEKPTQVENAKTLGISVDSYQERLEWAIKKIIKHYPEFTPKKRRSKSEAKKASPVAPLYQVLPSGEKFEIPLPFKREKPLSNKELFEIKKWSWESSKNYLFRYDAYTDVDDFEDEEELEAEQEAIEQEHQDHLLLKAEEAERKKEGQL
jgi:hypothetical protein